MSGKDGDVAGRGRGDRLLKEEVHDPYVARSKPREPTTCPGCGAVFHKGRWQWADQPGGAAHEMMCPACERIRDDMPAGILTLSGGFLGKHRDEILKLIHNKVEEEKAEHPMKRLMGIEDGPEGELIVRFTDLHLPRGAGEAIERAYDGELDIQYTKESNLVRVYWNRDE
ncbi:MULTISPECIES: BCAM0308 family protein [unclassified Marinobacter]|uniref:BCAM0308 family protein n=1 Tax=unclassified Marinobacter TaxID=83889 RepID=UPI0019270D53|nr:MULTISPECIES: BCAM0308 family protein [unclassified Marinobacter]MBL3826862.1 ATPase [Marinobacter sp. MC3]MBL3895431.1 ATPase [Marinobacter sp. MW3]